MISLQAPWDTSVSAAMMAAGLRTGDTALHIGRHFSLRDAMKWAGSMQVMILLEDIPEAFHATLVACSV